jgi:hypothetical protein
MLLGSIRSECIWQYSIFRTYSWELPHYYRDASTKLSVSGVCVWVQQWSTKLSRSRHQVETSLACLDPTCHWPRLLSLIGSALIIQDVISDRAKQKSMHHQLILCMSTFDLFGSLGFCSRRYPFRKSRTGFQLAFIAGQDEHDEHWSKRTYVKRCCSRFVMMIVACFSLFLVRRILGGTTLEIIRPATWARIMAQQPRLYIHVLWKTWLHRRWRAQTYIITVFVVYQTNGTSQGFVIFILLVGKDQVAFLSLQVAHVIFPQRLLCCFRFYTWWGKCMPFLKYNVKSQYRKHDVPSLPWLNGGKIRPFPGFCYPD